MDRGRHRGHVALVTGAGSGIGRATVLRLAAEGAHVVGCSPSPEGIEGTAAALPEGCPEAHLVPADLTDQAQLDAVVDAALARFGRIDVLANVAGISDWYLPSHEVDDETWDRVLAVNVTAVQRACRRVLPGMMERGAGVITNVGSVTSTTGAIGGLAYTTSKHAVVGITRSIAWTYQGHGIRCNAVCPGAVETALDRTAVPRSSWGYDQLKKTHRLCPRVAGPDEVAALVSWVSTEEASSLNGAVITADSGWTA